MLWLMQNCRDASCRDQILDAFCTEVHLSALQGWVGWLGGPSLKTFVLQKYEEKHRKPLAAFSMQVVQTSTSHK